MIFLSGIYRGHEGVARLYQTWFQQLFTQGRPGPEYGFLLDHFQMQDIITVAADGQSAKGRFRCLLAGGTHSSREYQPEGLPAQFYEAGVYENDYVREDGVWKIKRLDYMVQWQADYERGWHNTIAHLQPQVTTFPDNPLGPDELLPEQRQTWPHRSPIPQHYAHPVVAAGRSARERRLVARRQRARACAAMPRNAACGRGSVLRRRPARSIARRPIRGSRPRRPGPFPIWSRRSSTI